MTRKLMTGLRMEASGREPDFQGHSRVGHVLRRLSHNFAWPVLILLLILPLETDPLTPLSIQLIWWFGFFLCVLGLLLRIWAQGYSRFGEFALDGPCRHVRNPHQLAYLLLYMGLFVLFDIRLVNVAVAGGFSFVWMHLSRLAYERELYLNLGSMFLKYRQRVRLWVPSILPEVNRSGARFQLSRALIPEWREILWLFGLSLVYAIRNHSDFL